MATVWDHLSGEELEERFVGCEDASASRHFQAIWLLARGHTISQVSGTRGDMCEDHGVDEPEPARKRCCDGKRESGKDPRPEEEEARSRKRQIKSFE